ncbi:hypothetical protein DN614_13190 [Klebsiella michiganensis]|nr:hypothetical protein CHQ91_07170 [Klebsiella michiganensis]RWS87042.1 hypothetical protein DN614_13190 [Klebsiella michiganensis]
MEIFILFLFVIVYVLFLPEAFIHISVKHFILISDDEKYSVDNFEMISLLIKAFMCAAGAGVVITLFCTR